jgi:alanyl-tRNA synthetase
MTISYAPNRSVIYDCKFMIKTLYSVGHRLEKWYKHSNLINLFVSDEEKKFNDTENRSEAELERYFCKIEEKVGTSSSTSLKLNS